jgi:hypothetical protein
VPYSARSESKSEPGEERAARSGYAAGEEQ